MSQMEKARLLLRVGLAFSFIYPPVSAFINPNAWIGYFPIFLQDLFGGNDVLLLSLFGITEIIIALWILVGKDIKIPSLLASVYLAGIVLFNISLLDVVFRDISLLAMAIALVFLEKDPSK